MWGCTLKPSQLDREICNMLTETYNGLINKPTRHTKPSPAPKIIAKPNARDWHICQATITSIVNGEHPDEFRCAFVCKHKQVLWEHYRNIDHFLRKIKLPGVLDADDLLGKEVTIVHSDSRVVGEGLSAVFFFSYR